MSRIGEDFTAKVCLERALKDKLFGRKKGFPGRKQAFYRDINRHNIQRYEKVGYKPR